MLSALHLAWGLGASIPFRSRDELADAVVGTTAVPPPIACFVVAGALATGAALAANVSPVAPVVRRSALSVMAGVFAVRGALGLLGQDGVGRAGQQLRSGSSASIAGCTRRSALALSLGALAASRA